jgi:putative transcriptional regulator
MYEAEAIGGSLMENIIPEILEQDTYEKTLAIVQNEEQLPKPSVFSQNSYSNVLPYPLREYTGTDLDRLPWKKLGKDAFHIPLVKGSGGEIARLLKIQEGRAVPEHGHNGTELTMVLSGSFSDESGQFVRGDVETADIDVIHQPSADAGEDCICLVVTDAPLEFTSPLARLFQRFVNI